MSQRGDPPPDDGKKGAASVVPTARGADETLPQSRATIPVLKAVTLRALPPKAHWSEDTTPLGPPSAQPTTRRACLVVLAGPNEGGLFKLKLNASYVVGRLGTASIQISDDGVSREHARVTVLQDEVVLEDLGSRNGTFVGDQRITRHVLANEDLIRVGASSILKFCYIDTLEEEARRRLVAAALRDALTGVYNRRHFDERLASECAAARRHARALSLLLIDIDDFKPVNDRHGHPVGDDVLRSTAQALKEGVRQEDLVFRYGGEEFAVLLRETGLDGALRLAARLCKKVARLRHGPADGPEIKVTISVGVAAYAPDTDEQQFLQLADSGLYQAKRTGKNRAIAADPADIAR